MNNPFNVRLNIGSNTKPINSLVFLLFFLPLILLLHCKSATVSKDVRQVDTLINWVNMARETQLIDTKVISERVDSMELKLRVLNKDSQKIQNVEIIYDLKEYEGICRQYKDFIQEYSSLEFDNLNYSHQMEELKKKIIDGKISSTEFNKSIYPGYREKISVHLAKTKKSVHTIASIEEMYNRLNNILTAVYHNLSS